MTKAVPPVPQSGEASPSLRAQLLASEHWSLLAARATTQSELLARITIFLTLVSAGLVSLALIGQATSFDGRFSVFAIVLFTILLLVGTLTLLRVYNGMEEDWMLVIGMNRLRAGYAELAPGIDRYFIASTHDDERGVIQTYRYIPRASTLSQPLASSIMFILAVASVVAGVLGGILANAAGAAGALVAVVSAVTGIAYFATAAFLSIRGHEAHVAQHVALFPHPAEEPNAAPDAAD